MAYILQPLNYFSESSRLATSNPLPAVGHNTKCQTCLSIIMIQSLVLRKHVQKWRIKKMICTWRFPEASQYVNFIEESNSPSGSKKKTCLVFPFGWVFSCVSIPFSWISESETLLIKGHTLSNWIIWSLENKTEHLENQFINK